MPSQTKRIDFPTTISPSLRSPSRSLPRWERAHNAVRDALALDASVEFAPPGTRDHVAFEVSVLLTDDTEIRSLNALWRNKDRPTDVLSWPTLDGGAFLGDIAISLDTAKRQARARGWPPDDEIALLLLHGVLHLLGHEDDTEEQSERMKAIETIVLGKPLDQVGAANG